jgi:hypothetical protein
MPPKKQVAHVAPAEVVHQEPCTEAPLQTDGVLDHNASNDIDDDTLTHRIPQTVSSQHILYIAHRIPQKVSSQHILCIAQEILLVKHNHLIWSPKRNNIRQCQAFNCDPFKDFVIKWTPK